MKKLILTYLTFGIFTMSCQGQTERIETKLMNCIYENYEDKGTEFKKALSDFQKLLIDEKILKDGTGKSYKAIFEKIVTDDDFDYNPSISFLDKIIDIGMPQNESFKNCQSELRERAENGFSKGTELQTVLDSIKNSGNLTPSTVANGILSVLNEKDFELDYYKMSVFFLFDTINYTNDSGISRKLPEFKENETEYDLSKAINIYIDVNNQIFVNKEKVDIEKLKVQIREYEFKNKSESIISFKAERETMYKTYVDVQNAIIGEIQILREQLAKEKYNTELDKLTEEQQSEIKKIYPKKIVE
tara:strand:- start:11 stop:916 length:906 start_codon:yes stop_codon:yes gene_type:complete